MFKASGKITKVLAIITFIAGIIASVVGAIMLFSAETYYRYSGWTHPYVGYGFLVLIGGPIVSWLNANVFYALGEAADSAKQAAENTSYLSSELNALKRKIDTMQQDGAKPSAPASSAPAHPVSSAPVSTSAGSGSSSAKTWTCKKCGQVNSGSSLSCSGCGEYR